MKIEYIKLNKTTQLHLQIKRINAINYVFMQDLFKKMRYLAAIGCLALVICDKLSNHP